MGRVQHPKRLERTSSSCLHRRLSRCFHPRPPAPPLSSLRHPRHPPALPLAPTGFRPKRRRPAAAARGRACQQSVGGSPWPVSFSTRGRTSPARAPAPSATRARRCSRRTRPRSRPPGPRQPRKCPWGGSSPRANVLVVQHAVCGGVGWCTVRTSPRQGCAARTQTRASPGHGGLSARYQARAFHETPLGSPDLGFQICSLALVLVFAPPPVSKGPGSDTGRGIRSGEETSRAAARGGTGGGRGV